MYDSPVASMTTKEKIQKSQFTFAQEFSSGDEDADISEQQKREANIRSLQ